VSAGGNIMTRGIRYETKLWLNSVYEKVGTKPFTVNQVSDKNNGAGAPQNAHSNDLITKVGKEGKARGNRTIWAINPHNMSKWRRESE
jgi:hypothetical protein